ncbi:MAG: response regulator [Nitrospirae bacterium]|nr:response regulator [Nitrospirota bacterium]
MSGRAPNPNCLVTRTLGVEPYERCAECRLSTWQCLGMQYNVAVLFIFGGALVLFLTQTPWLHQAALTAILLALVVFGVTVNRQTDRMIQAARRLREEIARQKNLEAHLIQTEKLSAIGRLSAGVAHELNNALTPIVAYSEILMEQTEGKARESVGRIRQAAGRARQIVDSLLRFGRPTPPIRASVDTAKLIEETLAMVRYSFTTRGIEVTADLAPDLPPVFADATQIEQVLLNLLNNARDAMDKTPSPRLTVRAAPKGACVRLDLANNGPPIPPEILPRIFDPFFTTKEVGRGTGLGLALSYGIIRDHGGTIGAASRPGETVFSIELPAAAGGPRSESAPVAESAPQVPRNARILAVDDEAVILEIIRDTFAANGNEVRTAASGREAIDILGTEDFDLVLTDIKMPDMSGIELYDWIRESRPYLARRVLFVTGDVVDVTTQDLLGVSGRPYIAKPFRIAELIQKAQEIVSAESTLRA